MQGTIITSLTISEVQHLFRQELQSFFSSQRVIESQETDRLLTIKEAADYLSLSIYTVYSLVSKSEIPFSKPGKRLYFSKKELSEWINQSRKKTAVELAAESETILLTANSTK